MKNSILIFVLLSAFNFCTAQTATVGTVLNDSLAINGYTLFSPTQNKIVYLIDNCGEIKHQWITEENLNLSFYLFENGNLLYSGRDSVSNNLEGAGSGGILRLYDWDNNILWSYNYSALNNYQHHHDIAPLPNGNILLIAWQNYTAAEILQAGKNTVGTSLWIEKVVEIEPVGIDNVNVVWEWFAFDHLVQEVDSSLSNYGVVSNNPHKIDFNYYDGTNLDWQHFNAISYNANEDLIIVNSHVFNEFYIIDHSTTSAEAATNTGGNFNKGGDILYRWGNPRTYDRGGTADQKLFGQHHTQWIESDLPYAGSILIFNNGLGRPGGNYTSIDIVTPVRDSLNNFVIDNVNAFGPTSLTKRYTYPNDPFLMYNQYSGGVQMLPNENVLICNAGQYYFLELSATNQIVWQYKNPVSSYGIVSQGDLQLQASSSWRATKYSLDFSAFLTNNLEDLGKIELNAYDTGCILNGENSDTTTNILEDFTDWNNHNITFNSNFIYISDSENWSDYFIYNFNGGLVQSGEMIGRISIETLRIGNYILMIHNKKLDFPFSQKFSKI